MRRFRVFRATMLVLTVACVVTGSATGRHPVATSAPHDALPELETAPEQAFLDKRAGAGTPAIAPDAFQVIGEQQHRINARTAAVDPADAAAPWRFIGPSNIDNPHPASSDGGGRVPDIAVDPRRGHGATVYI